MTSDGERAAFEAGIKIGALYHQWVGTPVSPETAPVVERAIESAVALQPHVTGVRVRLDRDRMDLNRFGYSEVAGRMFDVEITTRVGERACRASLSLEEGYPLMRIEHIL